MSKTLKKWNKKGRRVIAGSTAVAFNSKGVALFKRKQTFEPNDYFNSPRIRGSSAGYIIYDEYYSYGDNEDLDSLDYDNHL